MLYHSTLHRDLIATAICVAFALGSAGCASSSADEQDTDAPTAAQTSQEQTDASEEPLILVNSDIEYVYREVTAAIASSKLSNRWERANKEGDQPTAAMYPPVVRSEQQLAGMVSSMFTKLEDELVSYYELDMASPLAFRGGATPEGADRIVPDAMLQRARAMKVDYLVTGLIEAERSSKSARYAFDIRIIDVASGEAAFRKKVILEKP